MRVRRRTSEARPGGSESIVDGSADAIALGTMAAGLVFGAALKSAPASADHSRSAPDVQAPAQAAVVTPSESPAPPPAAPNGQSAHGPMVDQHPRMPDDNHNGIVETSVAPGVPAMMHRAQDATEVPASRDEASAASMKGELPAPVSHVIPEFIAAEPAKEITSPSVTPQEAIAGIAGQIASAMGTLVDHIKTLSGEVENIPTLIQHATDIGSIATRMADDVFTGVTKGIEGLSEVLGGPPLDLGAAVGALAADLLPPSILGAASDAAHAGDAALSAFNTLTAEPGPASGSGLLDHTVTTVTEVAPLQLGFLGQSYVDAPHNDDGGPHTLSSPLHGFI